MHKLRLFFFKLDRFIRQKKLSQLLQRVLLELAEKRHRRLWVSTPQTNPSRSGQVMLREMLQVAGVSPGDTVLCHSSWDGLRFAFKSPQEVIDSLLDYLGPAGTLVMPAIPAIGISHGVEMNLDKAVSRAGIVSEMFRRTPGVVRSISLNHSVCALGPNALSLTEEHHFSTTSWDKYSPYRKIADIENAWIIGLGVGHRLRAATSLHCVESELIDRQYYARLFKEPIDYSFISRDFGGGRAIHRPRTGVNYAPKIAKYFSPSELCEKSESGVDFYAIRAEKLVYKAIELGRRGKTMYFWPIPWPWLFSPKSTGRASL